MTRVRSVAWLSLLAGWLVAGCAAAPASPEQRAAEELRLLQPLLAGAEVVCSELVVDATANFHAHIARPAVDGRAHQMSQKREGGGAEWMWTNRTGDPLAGFLVRIGAVRDPVDVSTAQPPGTTFRVTNRFTLRLHEDSRPLQLDVAAHGNGGPVQVAMPGQPRAGVARFTVRDGAMVAR
ncbi:MAG: hypothetical protein JNK49_11770 [Planctomycetes bacterium]|nr:hypothetical protein [Planctomycetota bacterium]